MAAYLHFHQRPAVPKRHIKRLAITLQATALFFAVGCRNESQDSKGSVAGVIVASDTILSGMAEALLPTEDFIVRAVLPPDQCPGHYDLKLSDIEKLEKADLIISFQDLPFMEGVDVDVSRYVLLDRQNRNWMVPDAYIEGLTALADVIIKRFPERAAEIESCLDRAVQQIKKKDKTIQREIAIAGIANRPVIASSLQRENLEWMGLRVIGTYGRPESMSAKEVVRLSELGRKQTAVLVVDNLQSGPEAGKGIADELGIPHVVISNFPSDRGYTATLDDNVAAVLAALKMH